MSIQLDLLKARVVAYKSTLDNKSTTEKNGPVSTQIAQQFNAIIEEIKKQSADATPHLPQPITCETAPFARISDIRFLDLEMMLNEVIAVLDVLRTDH